MTSSRAFGHSVTHSKRTTPDGARYELSIAARPGADMHGALCTLLAAFGAQETEESNKINQHKHHRVCAADAPSNTTISVNVGSIDITIGVPRVAAFDAHVTLGVETTGTAEPTFSDAQVRALERAGKVAMTEGIVRPLDGVEIVDENGKTFACRNPHMQHPENGESNGNGNGNCNRNTVKARAMATLAEHGVEVMEPSEMSDDWDSIAGYSEVKQRIQDTLVLPLQHPEVYDSVVRGTRAKYQSNIPKAVLYSGKPGCGKTLSARILAATIGIPFVHVPLESMLSKYYGETTRKLAAILEAADTLGKCIVFIDEADSLAASRSDNGNGGIHEVSRRTLSVLLRFIDGVDGPRDAIILAATNCADDIDTALLSRFDIVIEFPLPDLETRMDILKLYAVHLSDSDRMVVAHSAAGYSGRELLDVCEEAERTHAGKLVRGTYDDNVKNTQLPVLKDYVDAVKKKRNMSVKAVEERIANRNRTALGG